MDTAFLILILLPSLAGIVLQTLLRRTRIWFRLIPSVCFAAFIVYGKFFYVEKPMGFLPDFTGGIIAQIGLSGMIASLAALAVWTLIRGLRARRFRKLAELYAEQPDV